MKLIERTNADRPMDYDKFVFENNGRQYEFTYAETREIAVQFMFEMLREDIHYNIDQMNGDEIDLDNLDGITPEEFEDEVFESLREKVENITYPTNEYIYDVISDTYDDYTK